MKDQLPHIIKGCLDNRRVSQKALFEMYNKELLAKAYRLTNNKVLAKEATQECWIEAFNYIKNFNSEKGSFRNWVYTILIRSSWKVLKANPQLHTTTANNYHQEENKIIEQLSCQELLNEMSYIPDVSRMVFKLYVIEGYRHKEIAQSLEISASTSRVHLTKARKIMRERYAIINKTTYDEL